MWHSATQPNLFEDQAHAAVREELKARLWDWFAPLVDPVLDGRALPGTGRGQRAPLGHGFDGNAFVQPGPPDTIPVLE